MKKLTTLFFMLLISFCFVLTGCGETKLSMPETFSNVYSNGGFVVGAGNYMYFSNAYKSNSSLTNASDNKGDAVAQFSLKRVKLDTSHKWFDIEKNEENNIEYENVVNKIVGYQVSNIFVVNEYLYFNSPNIHKNKENQHEFTLTTLFRIKLDGTGMRELYTTKSTDAQIYLANNTTGKKVLIFDDAKIKSIDIENNSSSVVELAEDVESVVFPKQAEQKIDWLYYTSARDEEDQFTGNILNRVNVENLEVEEVSKVASETIKIITQDYDRFFYIKTGGQNEGLFSNDVENHATEIRHRTVTDGIVDGSDLMYVPCENSDYSSFVFIYNDNLYVQLITSGFDTQAEKLTTETTTLQFSSGSYIYYSTDSGIYRCSVMDRVEKQISDRASFNNAIMDFDGKYVYFFAKDDNQETETEYLYRADATASGELRIECIAELLEEDIPEDSDIPEEE